MRYVMKEKLFSWGDDFCIKDDQGRDVFFVDRLPWRFQGRWEALTPVGEVRCLEMPTTASLPPQLSSTNTRLHGLSAVPTRSCICALTSQRAP